jgi:hypothetical protein
MRKLRRTISYDESKRHTLRFRLENIRPDTKLGCRFDLIISEGRCEHSKEPLGVINVW